MAASGKKCGEKKHYNNLRVSHYSISIKKKKREKFVTQTFLFIYVVA